MEDRTITVTNTFLNVLLTNVKNKGEKFVDIL